MNFTEAVRSVLGQYANFNGRARRSEYWYFQLVYVAMIIVYFIGMFLSAKGSIIGMLFIVLMSIVSIALFVPTLAVTVRRLHDTNRSGWFWLLNCVPVGPIFLLIWFCTPGTSGPNQYGEDPLTKA